MQAAFLYRFKSLAIPFYKRIRSFTLLTIGLFYIASISSAHAAGPVVHALLANKWIAQHEQYNEEQKKSFMLGTLFPDIRYLGVITRKETHLKQVSAKDLFEEKDPFTKGFKFHSWVDIAREKMVVKSGIYKSLAEIPAKHRALFLKIVEDEILYHQLDSSPVREYLKNIDAHENHYGLDPNALMTWHGALTIYYTIPPSFVLAQLHTFQHGIGHLPPDTIAKWNELLPKYVNSPEMQRYTKELLAYLEGAVVNLKS